MRGKILITTLLMVALLPLATAAIQVTETPTDNFIGTVNTASSAVYWEDVLFVTWTKDYGTNYAKNTAYLQLDVLNKGGTSQQDGIIELQFEAPGLSFLGSQSACDPAFPYTQHRQYIADPNGGQRVVVEVDNIPEGTYNVWINHYDGCCTDGVNAYACEALQPPSNGRYLIGTYIYGDPTANVLDECDTDYGALKYLQAQGDLDCKTGSCQNPSASDSVAVCAEVGVCNHGATQTAYCEAMDYTYDVRVCNDGAWVDNTNLPNNCDIPPPPPKDDKTMLYFVGGALILIGALFLFKKK